MSVNLSIKDVPEPLAQRLRERAARNRRSLQGELLVIVEQAAQEADRNSALTGPLEGVLRQGWKSVEDLMAERRAAGVEPGAGGTGIPLGVDIIRADRDSR
ncbi:MAG: hypothetical protein M3Y32_00655 [Pseudomonadota bacterium]|nr:hypothetical protein [Pseudomonadota bacterium]